MWGPLRGALIVTSWHDYPAALLGYAEAALLRWMESSVSAGATWLDVGAHYGYTALALARLVGPGGRVYAFEPVLGTARCLIETTRINRLPQLRVVNLGLSGPRETEPMDVGLVRGMAVPREPDTRARDTIRLAPLDRVWSRLSEGDRSVQGIKIDVQGMELPALQGMRRLLEAQRPLLAIEFHEGVDRGAALGLLRRCGYQDGVPVAPLRDEQHPSYASDRTYLFAARSECAP